jgi:transcriptional regulator with XRE-family HTH domain
MESLGDYLKEVRTNQGFSTNQIAKETNIAKKYLDAIESEEFSVFPGEAYLKGFLRTYAEYLKLDPDEIVNKYERIKMAETPTPIEQLIPKPKTNPRIFYIIGGVILIPLVVFGIIQFYNFLNDWQIKNSQANKNKQSNGKNKYILNVGDKEKNFDLKKDDIVEFNVDDQKYFIKVDQVDPVVVIKDSKNNPYYLVKDHLQKYDLNNDQNYDIGLYLKSWNEKNAVILLSHYDKGESTYDSNRTMAISGENVEVIAKVTQSEKIDFNITLDSQCFLRYKIDNNPETEGMFKVGMNQNIKADKSVILWISNAGVVKLNFGKFNKIYTPGKIGEVSVKLINWNQISTGEYELQISNLK